MHKGQNRKLTPTLKRKHTIYACSYHTHKIIINMTTTVQATHITELITKFVHSLVNEHNWVILIQ